MKITKTISQLTLLKFAVRLYNIFRDSDMFLVESFTNDPKQISMGPRKYGEGVILVLCRFLQVN